MSSTGDPLEGAARDLPPAFPGWLKRRFPALRGEETNALYQAFRRRRCLYRPGFRARLRALIHLRGIVFVVQVAAIFALLVLAPLLFLFRAGGLATGLLAILFWPIVIGTAILGMVLRNPRTRHGDLAYLPTRVGEVFGDSGYRLQGAIDIWMCGFTGRDVAEAIFLENFERAWKPTIAAILLTFGLVGAVTVGEFRHAMDASSWSVLISAGAAAATMIWAILPQLHDIQGTRQLERRYAFWRSGSAIGGAISEFGRQFGENILRVVLSGIVAALLAILMAIPAIYTHSGEPGAPRQGIGGYFDTHKASVTFHLFFLWMTAFFVSLRFLWARHSMARLEKAIADAEYPFALLMASVVCEDPEGEAWARWRYGLRPIVSPSTPAPPPPPPFPRVWPGR